MEYIIILYPRKYGTTTTALVKEAKSEWGLKDGAKLMIAFTGRKMSDGTMGEVLKIE